MTISSYFRPTKERQRLSWIKQTIFKSKAAVKQYSDLPPGGYGSNNETGDQDQQNPEEVAGYAKNNQRGTVEGKN